VGNLDATDIKLMLIDLKYADLAFDSLARACPDAAGMAETGKKRIDDVRQSLLIASLSDVAVEPMEAQP